MPDILLQNRRFSYSVVHKSIRTLNLRLKSPDSFTVSCPRLTPSFFISQFIQKHADWIIRHSSKIVIHRPVPSAKLIQAKRIIISELQQLANQYHFNFGRVSVRNQKTRLGSCSHTGNLSFNWRIAFFPPELFRHILFHELVHLTIKNHSPRFWAALAAYDPNWHQNRRRIKSQSQFLPDNGPNLPPPTV